MAKRVYREASAPTKYKMSLSKQGGANVNYGHPRDEVTKAKIAQSMRDYWSKIPNKPPDSDDK